MFTILIVEDQQEKLKNILQTLREVNGIDEELIDTVIDAHDAKKKLLLTHYDLLILDISIPLRKSEEVIPEGGLLLLKEILARNKFKTPTHIIGLTSYEEIFTKVKTQFEEKVLTVIKYDHESSIWKTHLSDGVKHRIIAKDDAEHSIPSFDYDIAIVCALKKEFDAHRSNGWTWNIVPNENDDTIYYETRLKDINGKDIKIIGATASRMGMAFCSSLSMKMIHKFKPKYLLMTGIMAGVKDNVNLGDVVVANPIWDWGSGKWIPNLKNREELTSEFQELAGLDETENDFRKSIFQIDPYQFTRSTSFTRAITLVSEDRLMLYQLRSSFPKKAPDYDIKLIEGPVASGAAVLADKSILEKIKKEQHRKLVGIEMKAYGLFCAAESAPNPKPIPLCIKSVVDYGDFQKVDDYQEFGCYMSASISKKIFELILEIKQ